jgi:CBS domain-containing protein
MLQIRDVMTREVITVSPEHTLREAMEILSSRHVSGAPVVSNHQVVGVVSATDLMEFAAALPPVSTGEGDESREPVGFDEPLVDDLLGAEDEAASWFLQRWRDADVDVTERFVEGGATAWTALDEHTVAEVMTRKVVSLRPTLPLTAAADLLRTRRLHRVLVMEGEQLVGILSTSDIVRAVAEGKLTRTRYVYGDAGARGE